MKRKDMPLVVAGFALGVLSAPLAAQDAPQNPFYANAQVVVSDVDGFDNGTSLALTGGMDLTRDARGGGFGVEAEWTTDISEPEVEIGDIKGELSYWTLAGYGVYRYPLSQDLALRGRAGILYLDFDEDVNVGGFGEDDEDVNFSAGVGATYRLSGQIHAIAEYTYIDDEINHLSAGVQMRF